MVITAPSVYDLDEIVNLFEDTGILTARQAAKFDSANRPDHITINGKAIPRAKKLLKEYLTKGNYGYTGYSIVE